MKLASLKEGGRDGTLVVVDHELKRAVRATDIARTLQAALEDWENAAPRLNRVHELLHDAAKAQTINGEEVFALDPAQLAAPLPRAYEFVDGSAYLPHVERVRRAIRCGSRARTTASTWKPKSSSSPTMCRWR